MSVQAMVFCLTPLLILVVVLATTLSSKSHVKRDIETQSFTNSSSSPSSVSHSTASAAPASTSPASSPNASSNCFPALDFKMPSTLPNSTDGWWCDPATEYAFVGFSYEITACESVALNLSLTSTYTQSPCAGQSLSQLQQDFANMRKTFNSRYVRIYGACDNDGFYDDIITAAWDNSLGVHALIWVSPQVSCCLNLSLI